ncbi:hypothetical protein M4D55_08285 [Metabacillus idriensis]|jgi:hypothetical protein|uniref:Uncharacterized protein n=1 Tax=Metabacillus idriensis TaxID=324768 RepID=A0A6I2MA94_9BACI|nr:hypothetical protein [Metabacillus idriensis]MCM3595777.1 hypothetical protein [Metabacillus idriensis]MRX53886.1 hypothetical protein [Metabacillus idriensis]
MKNIDKRNRLNDMIFSYQITKDQAVLIYWSGKQIKVLKGKAAAKFLANAEKAETEKDIQLLLAKATGNFKRGNEKGSAR